MNATYRCTCLERLYGYETTLMVEDAYWAAMVANWK